MELLVGNLAHIVANIFVSIFGLLLVLYRVGHARLPRDILIGLSLVGLAFSTALISQPTLSAFAYLTKLAVLVFVYFFATQFPRLIVVILATVAFGLFFHGLTEEGYQKLNAIPIVEISLAFSFFTLRHIERWSNGILRLANIIVSTILILQGVALHSRSSISLGLLIVFFSLLPTPILLRAVKKLWLIPIFYIGFLAFLGILFISAEFELLSPTKSNIERTVMISVLIEYFPTNPFGIDQAEYSKSVAETMSLIGRKAYSEGVLDPHNFLGFIYMYSGWLGLVIFLFVLSRALSGIACLRHELLVLLVPLLGAIMTVCASPPSSWARLKVVCIFAVLTAIVRIRRLPPEVQSSDINLPTTLSPTGAKS